MKKQGFTLIELLAVIIILAVISLIATPIVLNVIDDARESGRKLSISGYADAINLSLAGTYYEEDAVALTEDMLKDLTYQGDRVVCKEAYSTTMWGIILHKCKVGTDTKEYYFAGNKVYESAENETYKAIYNTLPKPPQLVVDTLLAQYSPSNTVGLLKDDTGYYYKGTNTEVANNFIWFAGHLWRVISIDNDNNLTMITQQSLTAIQPTSSVWTTQEQYEASYINHWLNDLTDGVFLKSMEETDRNKIIDSTFNVGIYTNVKEFTTTQKVGLLDETQYTKAGGANSFLDIKDWWWLGNRSSTSYVRSVDYIGYLGNSDPANSYGARPVIKISNLTFTAGKGTLDDPYRESSTTTDTSNIKVGEYISIKTSGTDCGEDNRCLFRVVSKDNNSIKVTLNGLLSSTSKFAESSSDVTYTGGNTIDTKVKAFAETIDSKYRYSGTDKTFGIGTYPYVSGTGQDYKIVQGTKYTSNVGLPVVGEMFSGNDIDMTTGSTAKTFVNVATIENPTVSKYFWTMNAYSTSRVRRVNDSGNLSDNNPTYAGGSRPVLFLNASSSLTFTSGEGTAESPFMLG